jgi:hypothetical protein
MRAKDILVKKKYPDGYPDDVVDTLNMMSLTDGKEMKLAGSMPLRSQLYAGDYDAIENVEIGGERKAAVREFVKRFQAAVRQVQKRDKTYISDIKCGSVEEWKVVGEPYNANESADKLKELHKDKIVTDEQYTAEIRLLKPASKLSRLELLYVRHELRHNIIRWTGPEILKGHKTLVDGRTYTLEEAVQADTIIKMDVVGWVQNNRFTDFSCIYNFKNNGNPVSAGPDSNIIGSIRDNMYVLKSQGNYFKMAKRMFALAKIQKKTRTIEILSPMFTGDLGRLYHVYGDIGTIESLLVMDSDIPYKDIKLEVDQFKGRLSNIVLNGYLTSEDGILDEIEKAETKKSMETALTKLKDKLYDIMSHNAKLYLMKRGIMRPHSQKTRRINSKVLRTTLKKANFGLYY